MLARVGAVACVVDGADWKGLIRLCMYVFVSL